jgi:serine phosphatase RsbU (regulator of sigma subunit)
MVNRLLAQNDSNIKRDSLTIKLANAKHDSDKINLLIEYANQTHSFEPIEAKKHATSALDLAKNIGFEKGSAKANRIIGIISYKQGDFATAFKHYFDCLTYYEKVNELKGMASLYNNIGLLYGAKHDFQKSINYHKKSLTIKEKLKDEYGKAASYNNIGIIYSDIKLIDSSKVYHEKALEIRLKINDISGLGTSYYNIANNYFDLNNNKKSLEYHHKALDIFRTTNDYFNYSFCINEIAMNHLYLNEEIKSKQYADSALQIAIKNGIKEAEMEVYKTLYFLYNKLKDPVNELKYYKLFSDLKITLNSANQAAEIGKMETKFEYENKIKLQELEQEKKNVLQNAESKKQKTFISAIVIILILVMIFSFFLYNRFRLIQKQNKLIEQQKKIVDEKAAELKARQKEILDSIHYAKRIQYALLAHDDLLKQNLQEHFVFFKPKDIVSGDFYWATSTGSGSNKKFYMAVCDSTGHGVPGAFMSLLNIGFLNEAINEKNIEKPNEIFNYVRLRLEKTITQEGQYDGMDGILICYDKRANTIEYSAANNAPCLIRNNEFIELEKDRMPVGKGIRQQEFKLFSVDILQGDYLYLYTDGFADQFGGERGKKFKYKALNKLLLTTSQININSQNEILSTTFDNWKGDLEQVDDVLIVGFRV